MSRFPDRLLEIGADHRSYENWETGKHEPEFRFWPGIIRFLGYDPNLEPATLAERIITARRRQGISQEELARQLGLDPATVTRWETGKVKQPYPDLVRLFEEYVEGV